MKTALITGITGQDGSYLAEFLLKKGYKVVGIQRRSSVFNTERINHIYETPHFDTVYGDLTDASSINKILRMVKPDEIYNLGAQSHVRVSFDVPEYTANTVALGTLRILEALRENHFKSKFYQASSSEMFGKVKETPQKETTPFYPRSPYACAKVFAYWTTINYREAHGMFACNGILFNHESPRRGNTFVTKKIVRGLVAIKKGIKKKLFLGNLEAKRDWGYAKEYVEAMWMMLQQEKPDDYIIATGETHTVKEFVEECASYLGMPIKWEGSGLDEKGINTKTSEVIIEIAERYFRPSETDLLIGDATKAKNKLGWEPKVKFKELVKIMIDDELKNPT
ncbi:MAG: GDP-mannose 4,6-dehydratase [Nanoarchaeota archaeon]|nr:GDP-mannose 4,6-dehydratase [Nanoarchaeota archaeon]